MKKTLFAAAVLGTTSIAGAQGLDMCYNQVDLGGGLFEYEFTVQPDAGWVSGMGWRWLIFGDEPGTGSGGTGISPVKDFTMDPAQFPVGPWTLLTSTSGGHNGPTFSGVLDYWIPRDQSETLTWKGESVGNIAPGEMLFSTLAGTVGGALAPNWDVATVGCGSACPCACNFNTSTGSGVCDIFDFLTFQNGFVAGEDCVCNYDNGGGLRGICDIFDFLAFQNDFVLGCS